MKITTPVIAGTVIAATVLLSGCGGDTWMYATGQSSPEVVYPNGQAPVQYRGAPPVYRPVTVEKGYYMSQESTPVSHDAADLTWIKEQDPKGYTVELGRGEKASTVAKALQVSPKTERGAQIIYHNEGEMKSTGVYGSFKSKEEAEKAMQALPADVRAKSKISNWQDVQTLTGEAKQPTSRPNVAAPANTGEEQDDSDTN